MVGRMRRVFTQMNRGNPFTKRMSLSATFKACLGTALVAFPNWGTLIIQVPTADGTVICADIRQTTTGRNRQPTFKDSTKLFTLNNTCGFYISGAPEGSWGEGNTVKGKIDFVLLTKQWFSAGHSCSSIHSEVEQIRAYYRDKFVSYLSSIPLASRPNVRFQPDDKPAIFTGVGMFESTADRVLVEVFDIVYLSREPLNANVVATDHSTDVYAPGESQFMSELLSGHRAEFDVYRNEFAIHSVVPLIVSGRYESLGSGTVVNFARRVIALSSEHPLPGMTPGSISAKSQCLVVKVHSALGKIE